MILKQVTKNLVLLLLKKNIYENIKENIKNTIEPTELPSIAELTAGPSALARTREKSATL